jgi:ATP-binding cassette subfamily B multidrug efflux pump
LLLVTGSLTSILSRKPPLNRVSELYNSSKNSVILDEVLPMNDGNIEFKHMSFCYNEEIKKNDLKDICVSIKSGETIGIIGGTGSGKSTFAQLIARLYSV